MTWDNEKYKHIGNILAFLNPYLGSGIGYIVIRIWMGMHLNAIGEIYIVALGITIFIAITFKFIYFIKTQRKKFTYTIDQWLYIILAIAATCLLIELFMFEANIYE